MPTPSSQIPEAVPIASLPTPGNPSADLIVDTTSLREYAEACEHIATEMLDSRKELVNRLNTLTADATSRESSRGVKVLLGTVDVDYAGHPAGIGFADRIAEAGAALITVEQGFRALGMIAHSVCAEFSRGDELSAERMRAIADEYLDTRLPVSLEEQ